MVGFDGGDGVGGLSETTLRCLPKCRPTRRHLAVVVRRRERQHRRQEGAPRRRVARRSNREQQKDSGSMDEDDKGASPSSAPASAPTPAAPAALAPTAMMLTGDAFTFKDVARVEAAMVGIFVEQVRVPEAPAQQLRLHARGREDAHQPGTTRASQSAARSTARTTPSSSASCLPRPTTAGGRTSLPAPPPLPPPRRCRCRCRCCQRCRRRSGRCERRVLFYYCRYFLFFPPLFEAPPERQRCVHLRAQQAEGRGSGCRGQRRKAECRRDAARARAANLREVNFLWHGVKNWICTRHGPAATRRFRSRV